MDEHEGGSGDDSAPNTRETRLQERAIRERWPMSADVRVKVLKRLCKICDEDAWEGDFRAPGHREVISAAKALISADKLNLEQQKFDHIVKEADVPAVRDVLTEAEDRIDAFQPAPIPDPGGPRPDAPGTLP